MVSLGKKNKLAEAHRRFVKENRKLANILLKSNTNNNLQNNENISKAAKKYKSQQEDTRNTKCVRSK